MFLTTDGRPAAEPSRPTVQALGGDGALLGRLEVAPELADRIELVEALAAAAGVALDNARLQAELRAERREVLEAATRLVESRAAEERLAHLLPGGVAERLRADPEALTRTERLTATVLMSDVRGYSTLAETMPPGTLAVALNEHRAAMNEAILRSGGTVVQYVGDAVLAAFTDVQGPAHAERALLPPWRCRLRSSSWTRSGHDAACHRSGSASASAPARSRSLSWAAPSARSTPWSATR